MARILVTEDDVAVRTFVSRALQLDGHDIVTAEDGEEGLATAIEQKPDLIITDYQMPYMTGLEMCIELKKHEQTCNTPALILTARGFSLPQNLIDQTNIAGVISKPFSPRDVLAQVQELIGQTSTSPQPKDDWQS